MPDAPPIPLIEVTPSAVASATTPVLGLPPLVRLVRQLARAGHAEVALHAPEQADALLALIRRHGAPGITVHLASAEEAAAAPVRLAGHGVYPAAALGPGTPGPPVVTLMDAASRRAAEAHLWSSIRKTVAHDGVVAYYLARPLSRPLTRMALRTSLTPNQVTLFGLLVGIASGVVASRGGPAGYVGATLLFFLGLVLDCVDGEMARLTLGTSRLGQWLDTLTDDVSVAALTLGFGLGLQHDTGVDLYQWLGVGGAACVALGQAYIYVYLVRRGGPMDTATYPWFFASDTGFVGGERRSLVGTLAFAWRRDSMTALFVGLALAGQAPVILWLLSGGAAVYLALLVVDAVVKRSRGEARS